MTERTLPSWETMNFLPNRLPFLGRRRHLCSRRHGAIAHGRREALFGTKLARSSKIWCEWCVVGVIICWTSVLKAMAPYCLTNPKCCELWANFSICMEKVFTVRNALLFLNSCPLAKFRFAIPCSICLFVRIWPARRYSFRWMENFWRRWAIWPTLHRSIWTFARRGFVSECLQVCLSLSLCWLWHSIETILCWQTAHRVIPCIRPIAPGYTAIAAGTTIRASRV